MAFAEIEELLAVRLGFDIETIGSTAVVTMVRRAMEQAGYSDPAAYAQALRREPGAWDHFVDHVVVPETWFFRDVAPFELAAQLIQAHFRAGTERRIRILSCPCATGEEPYSLVLAMLHAGAPPDSFCVDAVDVSHRALEVARAAVFHPRSFRGDFPWDRETYFDRHEREGARQLDARARACVTFRQGNLIAPDFLRDDAAYDLVFCRNLLIYLHAEARLLAMTALRRLVADEGVLVLGHAEAVFARQHGFKPTGPPEAFAFIKSSKPAAPKNEYIERRNLPRNLLGGVLSAGITPPRPPRASIRPPAPAEPLADLNTQAQESGRSSLEMASQLADAGELHAALQMCGEHLQKVPDSPDGYFLLGVLQDALGQPDLGTISLRKVLYLEPNHREALLHLALKQEARGDSKGAALLRDRARRAEQADKPSNL